MYVYIFLLPIPTTGPHAASASQHSASVQMAAAHATSALSSLNLGRLAYDICKYV